jgi:hypothetical protein
VDPIGFSDERLLKWPKVPWPSMRTFSVDLCNGVVCTLWQATFAASVLTTVAAFAVTIAFLVDQGTSGVSDAGHLFPEHVWGVAWGRMPCGTSVCHAWTDRHGTRAGSRGS